MSTNIHFFAERQIIVTKTGERQIQREKLDVIQTPTDATNEIMDSTDPVAAYFDWVMHASNGRDYLEDVYADDDVFCEREPIGTRVVNSWKKHAEEFMGEVKARREAGWDIRAEAW